MSKVRPTPRINIVPSRGGGPAGSAGGIVSGAGSQPATVDLATGNTVAGITHTHQLDIAAHTANVAAHHSPVTVTNAGLALAGQALGLSLAATSGLQIDGGLMLADSIAGEGLEIAGKVLAVNLAAVSGLQIDEGLMLADSVAGGGLVIAGKVLSLGTPGGLTALTPNVGGAAHTHAVEAYASTQVSSDTYGHLLKSDGFGGLALTALDVSGAADIGQGLTAGGSGFRVIHHTHDYDHVHVVVNPGPYWNLDEQFGVDIDDSLLVRGYIVGKHALQIKDAVAIFHFDGLEPYETDFTGSPTGHMGQSPTYAGATIYRPGLFGKALQCGNSTTNLVPNPSLENDLSGWSTWQSGTGATWTRDTTRSWIGSASVRILASSSGSALFYNAIGGGSGIPLGNGESITFQARMYCEESGKQAYIQVRGTAAGSISEYFDTVAGEWVHMVVSHTNTSGAGETVQIGLGNPNADGTTVIWLDAIQAELAPYPTPYCDGSLGPMHAWDNPSSPHESTSTRAAAYLRYEKMEDTFLGDRGTVMAWVRLENNASRQGVLQIAGEGATYIILRIYPGGVVHGRWGGRSISSGGIAYVSADTWHHLAVVADGTDVILYIDAQAIVRSPLLDPYVPDPGAYLYVGCDASAAYSLNGLIDDLVIVKRALSADEIRAVYESNAPVFAETSTWHWRAGRNLVWADAEGFWAVDQAGDKTFAISGVDGKSWGGATLGAGDVFIGNVGQGHYLHWDDSASKLTIRGDVAITGSVSVAWDEITNEPDGATRLGTGANPGGAGLWLTGDYMGYHAGGGTWPVWISSQGRFAFGNSTGTQYVKWDGSTFEVKGQIVVTGGSGIGSFSDAGALATANNLDGVPDGSTYGKLRKTIIGGGYIQVGSGTKDSTLNGWHIGSSEIVGQASGADQVVLDTSGKITAGAGAVTLDSRGISITASGQYGRERTYGFKSAVYEEDLGGLYTRQFPAPNAETRIQITTRPQAGRASTVYLSAESNITDEAAIFLTADREGATYHPYIHLASLPNGDTLCYMDADYFLLGDLLDGYVFIDGQLFIGGDTRIYRGAAALMVLDSDVRVTAGLGVNVAYTPGAGDISAGRYLRTDGDRVYFNGSQWLRRNGTHLEWWNGSAYVQLD